MGGRGKADNTLFFGMNQNRHVLCHANKPHSEYFLFSFSPSQTTYTCLTSFLRRQQVHEFGVIPIILPGVGGVNECGDDRRD